MTAPCRWSFTWRTLFMVVAIPAAPPSRPAGERGHWRRMVPRFVGTGMIHVMADTPAKPRRRWTFGLRTLFVVVGVQAAPP